MKKIWQIVLAAIFAIAGVFALATPAQAFTMDCWPGTCSGVYHSSDRDSTGTSWGALAGHGADYLGVDNYNPPAAIYWYSDHINILGPVFDGDTNGLAPVVQFKVCWAKSGCNGYGPGQNRWHWTGGNGTEHVYNSNFYPSDLFGDTVDDSTEVSIRVCDGVDSNSNAINCDVWHGPFHRY